MEKTSEKTSKMTISSYEASDGASLSYRHWAGLPGRPVIVHLHGIEGHSQWLEPTANILNEMGMTVYAPDRRGSGLNNAYRGHMPNYQQILFDIKEMLVIAANEKGPLFLVGNCWGAKPAVVLISQWQKGSLQLPPIKGLILTSPALITKADLTFPQKIKVAIKWLIGVKSVIPIPLTPEMFTDNKPYLDFITNDPKRLTHATAHFFANTFFLTEMAKRMAGNIQLPVLVLQAGRDEIVNLPAIENWFSKVAAKDKTFKLFPWMSHSLDFDVKADEYIATLTNWINEHASSGGNLHENC